MAVELSSLLPQTSQPLCPETPLSDDIAIWRPISPAWTADRLVLRASKLPRSSAKIRPRNQPLMALNMAASSPFGKQDRSHIDATLCHVRLRSPYSILL